MNKPENNPLVENYDLPQFSKIAAEHIKPAVDYTLSEARKKLSQVENSEEISWQSLIEPLSEIGQMVDKVWSPVSHLNSVRNSQDLRVAYQENLGDIVQFSLEMSQSSKIFKALEKLSRSDMCSSFDGAQKRILENFISSAKLSGVGLEGENKEEFNRLAKDLSELETSFSNNVLDATKEFQLLIDNKSYVDSMPQSFLALASQTYEQKYQGKEKKSSTPEDGPWLVTLDAPSFIPFMESCPERQLREKVYKAYITRASSGSFNNEENICKILQYRKRQAELLGYKNYAHVSLARKMAPSVESVYQLETDLLEPSFQAAKKEFSDLNSFAKSQGFKNTHLSQWDTSYWAKKQKEHLFDYTEDQLKPYFSLSNVLKGLFDLSKDIFGIKIVEDDTRIDKWHEDVRFFKIFDEQNQHIASFYLDPFSRPENKRGGAWMGECIVRQKRSDATVDKPVAYLVCNFTPPLGSTPSLLTFRDVETLFHEFGHGLQHMLTKVDYPEASGINGVEWDAVELPSQFMENWCYHEKTFFGFAKHYETQETLDKKTYQKLVDSRKYLAGSSMLRQIQFGLIDMELHDQFDPTGSVSVFEKQLEVVKRTSVLNPLEEDRFICGFSHIFAGGYAAGYYSYKWAEVLSADAFSLFEEVGLENKDELKKIGHLFKDTVLSLGGGEHPMTVFERFRGRPPKVDALLKSYGLSV